MAGNNVISVHFSAQRQTQDHNIRRGHRAGAVIHPLVTNRFGARFQNERFSVRGGDEFAARGNDCLSGHGQKLAVPIDIDRNCDFRFLPEDFHLALDSPRLAGLITQGRGSSAARKLIGPNKIGILDIDDLRVIFECITAFDNIKRCFFTVNPLAVAEPHAPEQGDILSLNDRALASDAVIRLEAFACKSDASIGVAVFDLGDGGGAGLFRLGSPGNFIADISQEICFYILGKCLVRVIVHRLEVRHGFIRRLYSRAAVGCAVIRHGLRNEVAAGIAYRDRIHHQAASNLDINGGCRGFHTVDRGGSGFGDRLSAVGIYCFGSRHSGLGQRQ